MMRTPASCVSITIRLDVVDAIFDLLVQGHRGFNGRLRVKLGGKEILNNTFSMT